MGQVGVEPIEASKNQKQLEQQQEHNDAHPAEHHMGKALLALLQESKAQVFIFRHMPGFLLSFHFYSALSFFT